MKNKVVRLLLMAMVVGNVITGCGSEKGEVGNTEVASTEMGGAETAEISYVEMAACYLVENEEDIDTTFADGEKLDWTTWARLETKLFLGESIDIYNESKGKMGYTKENINVTYVAANGDWSQLAIGEDGSSAYVRTEDLLAILGGTEAVYEDGTDVCLISNARYGDEYYDGTNIDMNTLTAESHEETTDANINVYSQGKRCIGYIKTGVNVSVVTSSDDWTYVSVTDGNYIVRTEDLNIPEPVKEEPVASASQQQSSTQTQTQGSQSQSSETQQTTTANVNYPAGNYAPGSVYGPKLTQQELNDVAEAVNVFLATYDTASMADYTKVLTAHDYLCNNVSYAASWAENRANTAWGALVYGEAQCSGYARAMKALCDAMGVGCYYVHADDYAINPSHQWNVVCVDGNWYIIDVQCNDSSGWYAVFLVSDDTYASMGLSWDRSLVPACPYDYGY